MIVLNFDDKNLNCSGREDLSMIYDTAANILSDLVMMQVNGFVFKGVTHYPVYFLGADLKCLWEILDLRYKFVNDEFCPFGLCLKRHISYSVSNLVEFAKYVRKIECDLHVCMYN